MTDVATGATAVLPCHRGDWYVSGGFGEWWVVRHRLLRCPREWVAERISGPFVAKVEACQDMLERWHREECP